MVDRIMNRKKHHSPHEPAPAKPDTATPAPSPSAEPPATPSPAETPPAAPPPPPAPSPAELELAAMKDKYLRLLADFDNFRKRQTRDREDHSRRATEALILELLPVLDHLELALANAPNKAAPLAAGVQMVADQFLATLARFDLKPFQSVGEPFDTARHEAVSEMTSAEVPAHRVLYQLRRGYLLGGRLLRPAQVIISGGPAVAVPSAPDCDDEASTMAAAEAAETDEDAD